MKGYNDTARKTGNVNGKSLVFMGNTLDETPLSVK